MARSSGQRQRKPVRRAAYRPRPIPDDAETTVNAIKAEMALRRAEFRERIIQVLARRGIASTSELRSECPEYRSRHLKVLFWFRLTELEATGAISRAGVKRNDYVEILWKLPAKVAP